MYRMVRLILADKIDQNRTSFSATVRDTSVDMTIIRAYVPMIKKDDTDAVWYER